MYIRTTPLQNWERAALYHYAQRSEAFRAASASVWLALHLRNACAEYPRTRSDSDKQRSPSFFRPVPLSANPEIETRLYALFAE